MSSQRYLDLEAIRAIEDEGTGGRVEQVTHLSGSASPSTERAIRILMLEDSPADAELIEINLIEAHLPVIAICVDTREEFVRQLEEFAPDVILSDYSLPKFSGAEALHLVQDMGLSTPFILVSGAVGDERAVEILKNGATDYVLKGRLPKLVPAVLRALKEVDERDKRHEAESLLSRQTELFQTLLQTQSDMGVGVVLIDNDHFVFVNDAYCALTGYSRDELLTLSSVSKLIGPPMREDQLDSLLHIQHDEQADGLRERIIICKDGQYIAVEMSTKEMELDGRAVKMSIVRNITERKQAEANLTEIMNRLKQSNLELERFAFAASHDLQEPLRKIQAFASRLRDKYSGQLSADATDSLDYILTAAKRLEAMIKGVLTLSRVATRGQPFERVNLEEVAREVLADLELRIEKIGARVEIGDLPVIDADPAQMRQLLQNLIGNALKFHNTSVPPLITVVSEAQVQETALSYRTTGQLTTSKLTAMDAELGHVQSYRIVVEDNGVGFDEKFRDRIFMPFQRLHSINEYEGTGMGLAICRKIVERHDGTMTATSAPGRGAKFIVTLPSVSAVGGDDLGSRIST